MKPHYVPICGPKPRRTPNKNLLFDLHSRLLTQSKLFFLISNYLYLLCLHCYSCHTACCRTGTVIKHRHEPGSASLVVQMVNGLVLMHHFSTVLEHLKRFIQHVSSPFSTPNTHTTDCWWWFNLISRWPGLPPEPQPPQGHSYSNNKKRHQHRGRVLEGAYLSSFS